MRSTAPPRRRRAVRGYFGSAVVLALALGLTPAPATASEQDLLETTASTTGTSSTEPAASNDTTTTEPTASTDTAATEPAAGSAPSEAVTPTEATQVLVALASAQQLNVALGGDGVGGISLQTSEINQMWTNIEVLHAILADPPPLPPIRDPGIDIGQLIDVDDLLIKAQVVLAELEAMLPDRGDVLWLQDQVDGAVYGAIDTVEPLIPGKGDVIEAYEYADAEVARARALTMEIVESLRLWALAQVGRIIGDLPTAEEVVALARNLADWANAQADSSAQYLLGQLAPWITYFTDEQHQKNAKNALTTLVIALGNVINPLPAALAPTSESAYAAAGEFLAWADELVQQGVAGPGPFYDSADTDSDEATASPTDDVQIVDSDVVVADEPVGVAGPVYPMLPPSPLGGATMDEPDADAGAVWDCGMYKGETCAPPMRRGGGRIIHRPIVRVVLVGKWWREHPEFISGFDSLFGGMSGSGYQNILRQYYDLGGYVGPEVVYQGTHILDVTPPAVVTTNQVGSYAVKAARARSGWKTSPSVVWVVALPPKAVADTGSENGPEGKCGYQGFYDSGDRRYYIAEVDYPREGCDFLASSKVGSATVIAAHEYVGVVTNPDLDGWRDGTGQHLPDLCRARFIRGPGGQWVSKVWSNGDKRCASTFSPRFSYSVSSVKRPDGDTGPNSPFTRGHSYPGAAVVVRNTGNITWLSRGGKITYLATSDNLCSPYADPNSTGAWASCRRITLPHFAVAPGEDAAITFSIKPDGSLRDGASGLSESFTMVAGSTWMSNTGSASARLSGLATNAFDAVAVGGLPNVGYVAVGVPGQETKVKVTLRNTGTAFWYPREVVNIGTPVGTSSPFAASDWPKGPGGCRACRAHRITSLVPPGGVYTLDLTLRIPASATAGLNRATFLPFADVVRVADRGVSPRAMDGGRFTVTVVIPPSVVGTRQVTGMGLADPGVVQGGATSGFSCAAVSNVDAVSTSITSCTATVTSAGGYSYSEQAAPATLDGAVAVTAGRIGYDESAGDTIRVCWTASTSLLDGTKHAHTGCS